MDIKSIKHGRSFFSYLEQQIENKGTEWIKVSGMSNKSVYSSIDNTMNLFSSQNAYIINWFMQNPY